MLHYMICLQLGTEHISYTVEPRGTIVDLLLNNAGVDLF